MQIRVFLFLFFISSTALAQKATVKGRITDAKGDKMVGATVSIKGISTGTNDQGEYQLGNLNLGTAIVFIKMLGKLPWRDTIELKPGIQNYNAVLQIQQTDLGVVGISSRRLGNRNAETLVKIENSIMPVTVINRRTIELMGSRRLDEVLKEQTGIAIVNDVTAGARSTGVQMQGFGSEYIQVLIDGQPLVGRNGGNFDLSRISVSNVERIEITKGASSLIYGGDALGGTINVITKHQIDRAQAYANVNYGTNETIDITLDGETPLLNKKASLALSANYYHTAGFNTSQGLIIGTTAPPFDNYAGQARFRYAFNEKNKLSVMSRVGLRRSFMSKDFSAKYTTQDVLDETDLNLGANFEHQFSGRWRSMTRYYFTRYAADMTVTLAQGDSLSQTSFGQLFNRLEQQVSYIIPDKLDVVTGLGGTIENIDQNILNKQNNIKAYFGYTQANWKPMDKIELIGGMRYDRIVNYGWRLDPSMAIRYKVLKNLTFKAAYGTAFKAPDMRKLYQTFYNPSSNYLLVGASVLRNTMNSLLANGQVSQYELESAYNEIKGLALKAEMNRSYNAGLVFETSNQRFRAEAGIFYHDIRNQINPVLVGRDIQGNFIYSYRNNAKAVYRGADVSLSLQPVKGLQISGGYQYLEAKDQSIMDEIKEGGKFYLPLFDPNNGSVNYSPTAKDYWGIENRSKHMFNARVFYSHEPTQLSANVRLNYRGMYPFSDKNNNGYMDRFDTFVRQHYLLNAGLEKKLMQRKMTLRLNVENILNFVDQKVPSQAGRLFFTGVAYNLN